MPCPTFRRPAVALLAALAVGTLTVGPATAATAAPAAGRDRSELIVETPGRAGIDPFTVILLDEDRGDAPIRADVLVTVTPKGGRPHRAVAHRVGRNGRTTFGLPKTFAGRVTVVYPGDRTHRPATTTTTVAGPPPPPVYVPPTSVTFGEVLSCKRTADDSDMDVTFTVVAHGGTYSDLGNADTHGLVLVRGGDHAFTIRSDDGAVTVGGPDQLSPQAQQWTFTPAYAEDLGPYEKDLYLAYGASRQISGTFPDMTADCPAA